MLFFRSALWPGLVVAVRTIVTITINKLVAVYYGPAGITLLAHFQNLVSFFLSIQSDGVNVGVVRFLSSNEEDTVQKNAYFNAGLILNVLFFLIPCLFLFLFSNLLLTLFDYSVNSKTWLFLFLAGIFLQMLSLYFISVILAEKKLKLYALVNIISSISSLVLSYLAAKNYSLTMVLLVIAIAPSVSILVTIYYLLTKAQVHYKLQLVTQAAPYKELLKFSAMAISILVFGRLTDFLVRQYAIQHFALYETGLWQSAVKLSDSYTGAFIAIIGAVYFPKIAELQSSPQELRTYVRKVVFALAALLAVGFILLAVLKEQVLLLLYQKEFAEAAAFVNYQLIADFFRLIAFLLGYLIIARAKTGLFIVLEAASAIVYIFFIFLLINLLGIESMQVANIIRYFLYLITLIIINRKYLL